MDLRVEAAENQMAGESPTFTVSETYVASDGEAVRISVDVCPGRNWDGSENTVVQQAVGYFQQFGYAVVESAKQADMWPLPSDHPNAPRNA